MAFGDNRALITSSHVENLVANNVDGDVYFGTAGADAFVISDGNVGDDIIAGFGSNDSLIVGRRLFDGNGDGYIQLSANQTVSVDRFGSGNSRAGADQITLLGVGADQPTSLRFLGGKDGAFVYAEADARDTLLGHFKSGFQSVSGGGDISTAAQNLHIDNDVADNVFDMSTTSVALLTDNALGLNFGGDTIKSFGDDDLLIFTSKLFDRDGSGTVSFGRNEVLDLSGGDGSLTANGAGGQLAFVDAGLNSVHFLGEKLIDGITFYFYGTANSSIPTGVTMS